MFAVLGMIGCDGGETTDDPVDTDTDGGSDCANGIVEFFPADAATGVYYRTTVEVLFEATDGSEALTLSSADGDVSGTTTWEDTRAIFWPDTPLTSSTEYTLQVDYECGSPTVAFTTSEVGPATTDLLDGNAYSLDLANGRWVEPAGVGSLIGSLIGDVSVLMGISVDNGDSLDMIGALGAGGGQDLCTESIPFPDSADFAQNPYFEVSGDAVPINVKGYEVVVENLLISGAFSPDGTYVDGATLGGKIDTRPLGALFGLDADDPNAVCDFLTTLQLACDDCGNGEVYCLSMLVDSMVADQLDGVSIVERSLDDIAADPNCAE
jgi:hypothetical protein